MVWVWLVYRAWRDKSTTVAVPNGALAKYGVSREVKRRALAELETAGHITVARRRGKTPIVTVYYL
jgi:hypothetical protein